MHDEQGEYIMDKVSVVVIGLGNMGTAHATCIAKGDIQGMELVAVCDRNSKKTAPFAEKYPNVKIYTDYKVLLKEEKVDAVIIAVPHPLHSEMAIYALEQGVHVLLEKPADISVSKVKEMNAVAEKSNKVFSIMFNQRTNQLFARAREIVRSGQLGELKRTVWIVTNWYRTQCYYKSGDWRATWKGEGGGVLLNQAPHNLDLWQWICGMPESVIGYCDIAKYHEIEVEDDATILTRYKNGATGTFITSTGEFPGTNRLEISGDLGKLVLEGGVLKWWKLKESERTVCATSEKGCAKIDYEFSEYTQEKKEGAHKAIIQNFTNAILHGEELLAPGTDGIYELTLSNAAYLSSWLGHQEVQLPFDTEEFDRLLEEHAKISNHIQVEDDKVPSDVYKDRWQVNW
jgi:predicted dehydrogenase